ncbi:MAG TPA: DUF4491 family protein [Anaerolineales bacterium]|nr:DUF4491 family protein [Anaerolineales bacterium]
MSFIGLVAAVATFFSIWLGHVAVRKVEFISPTIWLPTVVFAIAGITLEWFSLSTSNFLLSAAFGIIGITFLWDALEFTRQQNRIKKGHSPANPQNPRHARLMCEYPAATNLDLLKREPLGKAVSPAEAVRLITEP